MASGPGVEQTVFQEALTHVLPSMFLFWHDCGDFWAPIVTDVASPSRLLHFRAAGTLIGLTTMCYGASLPLSPFVSLLLAKGPAGLSPPSHVIYALDAGLAKEKLRPWLEFGYTDTLSKSHTDPLRQWLINEHSDIVSQVSCPIPRSFTAHMIYPP